MGASDGADRASTSVWHFGWNNARRLAQITNEGVPAKGLKSLRMWEPRRQARRHVERYITRMPTAGADLENASQGTKADAGGGFGYLRGPVRGR